MEIKSASSEEHKAEILIKALARGMFEEFKAVFGIINFELRGSVES
jgi:hypothetical protein